MIILIQACLWFGLPSVLDRTYLSQHKSSVNGFDDIAQIEKVVALEVTPDSVFGFLKKVAVAPRTQDLYTLDEDGSPLRVFSSTGQYVRTLGKRGDGPGEIKETVYSFCFGRDCVFVVTPRQLLKFAMDGSLRQELDLSPLCFPGDIACTGDTVFLSVLRANQQERRDLLLFDQELRPKKGLLDFDLRKQTYLFTQGNTLAVHGDRLYAIQTYRPRLDIIKEKTLTVQSLSLVQENQSRLDAVWAKPQATFTEADRKEISAYLHRFAKVVTFGTKVLLFDIVWKPQTRRLMYELEGETVKVYDRYHFWNPDFRGKSLIFPAFPGSYADGAIGQVEHDKDFAFLERSYPEIAAAQHQEDDNMLLVFFRPKPAN